MINKNISKIIIKSIENLEKGSLLNVNKVDFVLVKNDFTYDGLILVLGILEDKNIENMLSEIIPLSDTVIVTKSNSIRACNPNDLKEKIEKQGYKKDVIVFDSIPESIQYVESIATLKDLVCVSGSLFTIGEARGYFFDSKESC